MKKTIYDKVKEIQQRDEEILRLVKSTTIYDDKGNHINPNEEVIFGDNVWMGCRCTVMKGCYVPDGSVIGACSIVRRKLLSKDAVYAGLGPKIVRENIKWDRKLV